MGFVDLHCHILPCLDDGTKSSADALALGRLLGEMGFDVVCATPHQKMGVFLPSEESIKTTYATLKQELPLDLRLGAENFWDEIFLERSLTSSQPMYTGGKAFLFEIHPKMAPPRFEDALFKLRMRGPLPVMAHPERYNIFWDDWDKLERASRVVAMVIDLGALAGAHGDRECEIARKMVKKGAAHAAATDTHSSSDIRSAAQGITWIQKHAGQDALTRLLDENPRRILEGDLPENR